MVHLSLTLGFPLRPSPTISTERLRISDRLLMVRRRLCSETVLRLTGCLLSYQLPPTLSARWCWSRLTNTQLKTQCLRSSLRPASTCFPHTSLHCSTCRYHLP